MTVTAWDADAYSKWIGDLRLESKEASPVLEVSLANDPHIRAMLSGIVASLTQSGPQSTTAQQALQAIFDSCRDIEQGRLAHLGAAYIKQVFSYYDKHILGVNEIGLEALSRPFLPTLPSDHLESLLKICLTDLMLHIALALRNVGMLDLDPGASTAKSFIVNGFYRTGSTKVFLTAQAILKAVNKPFVIVGADLNLVDEKLDAIDLGAYRGQWVLIKSHHWMPLRSRNNSIVVFTRRNIVDVAASSYRRGLAAQGSDTSEGIQKQLGKTTSSVARYNTFLNRYVAPKYDLFIVDYEEYHGRDSALVRYIAGLMDIDMSPELVKQACEFIDVQRVKRVSDALVGSGDPDTLIQPFHISETLGEVGAGLETLPKWLVDDLKLLGQWPEGR